MDEVNQTEITSQAEVTNSVPSDSNDISKTTITILVLLTLMISIIGTWTVLNEVNNVKIVSQESTSSGIVSLNLQSPNQPTEPVAASGRVVLNILK